MLNNNPRHPDSQPPQQRPALLADSVLEASRFKPEETQRHAGQALAVPSAAPVPSATLLRGHKTVDIAHNGMLYTLQATKLGKLILTK